jgi:hypothetical protein
VERPERTTRRRLNQAACCATSNEIRSHNLIDRKDRKVWNAITGDHLGKQPFWPKYTAHVERRNEVVHKGRLGDEPVGRSDAEQSVEAVRQLLDHITKVLEAGSPPAS